MTRSIPKYSKEYDSQSPYAKELRNRSTVNTALWGSSGGKRLKCELCKQTLVTPAGQTYLQCQSCGKITYPEVKQDKTTLTDPNAKTTTGLIISQPRKNRRTSGLDGEYDDETLDDLRSMGIEPTSWKDYFPT
jgi:hypothetical protein